MRSTSLIHGEQLEFRTQSSDFLDYLGQRGQPSTFQDVQVALFSRRNDPEMDAVGIMLLRAGIPYIRLNVDELLAGASCQIVYDAPAGRLALIREGIRSEPSVAVFHLFDTAIYPHGMDARSAASWHYAREAWQSLASSVGRGEAAAGVRAINSPAIVQRLTRLQQMRIAAACGLRTPRSVVVSEVADGYDALGVGHIIVKPVREHFIELSQGDEHVLFGAFPQVLHWPSVLAGERTRDPVLVQEFIPHQAELRVYALRGEPPAALEIRAANGAFTTAYSAVAGGDVLVTATELPARLAMAIAAFMDMAHLDYGAFDLVRETASGDPVFLEVNTSGGWRCYERLLGSTDITRRFTSYVMSAMRAGAGSR